MEEVLRRENMLRAFRKLGLPNLLDETHRQMQRSLLNTIYGTVRTVVWKEGRGDSPPPLPISWDVVETRFIASLKKYCRSGRWRRCWTP